MTEWKIEQREPTDNNPSGLILCCPEYGPDLGTFVNDTGHLHNEAPEAPPGDLAAQLLDRWRAWKQTQGCHAPAMAVDEWLTPRETARDLPYMREALAIERKAHKEIREALRLARMARDTHKRAAEILRGELASAGARQDSADQVRATRCDSFEVNLNKALGYAPGALDRSEILDAATAMSIRLVEARRSVATMRDAVDVHSGRYDAVKAERAEAWSRLAEHEGRIDELVKQRDEAIAERSRAQEALAFFKPGLGVPFAVKDWPQGWGVGVGDSGWVYAVQLDEGENIAARHWLTENGGSTYYDPGHRGLPPVVRDAMRALHKALGRHCPWETAHCTGTIKSVTMGGKTYPVEGGVYAVNSPHLGVTFSIPIGCDYSDRGEVRFQGVEGHAKRAAEPSFDRCKQCGHGLLPDSDFCGYGCAEKYCEGKRDMPVKLINPSRGYSTFRLANGYPPPDWLTATAKTVTLIPLADAPQEHGRAASEKKRPVSEWCESCGNGADGKCGAPDCTAPARLVGMALPGYPVARPPNWKAKGDELIDGKPAPSGKCCGTCYHARNDVRHKADERVCAWGDEHRVVNAADGTACPHHDPDEPPVELTTPEEVDELFGKGSPVGEGGKR